MKKTLFTLISGDQLKSAPGQKVIDGNSISTLVEAKEIREKIEQEADNYREDVAKECEKIREKAYKDGFLEGQENWVNHVKELEDEIAKVRTDMEALVIPLALKAAKKIVGREIELNEKTVVDIIANNLKAVAAHKRITIYVNKQDFDLVEGEKQELKKIFEALETLSIQERHDIEPQGCLIETEAGIINAQIDNQWRILEKAFEAFAPKNEGNGNETSD